jgi:hypothetical protein
MQETPKLKQCLKYLIPTTAPIAKDSLSLIIDEMPTKFLEQKFPKPPL